MLSLNTEVLSSHLLCDMANVCKSTALHGSLQVSTQQTFSSLHCLLLRPEQFSLCPPFPTGELLLPSRSWPLPSPNLLLRAPISSLLFFSLSLTVGLFSLSMLWCFLLLNVLPLISHPLYLQHGFSFLSLSHTQTS